MFESRFLYFITRTAMAAVLLISVFFACSGPGGPPLPPFDDYTYTAQTPAASKADLLLNAGAGSKPNYVAGYFTSIAGYATLNGGTTGGSGALPAAIYTVYNRLELKNAFTNAAGGGSSAAKIIYVSGAIDLCVDDTNNHLTESDFITIANTTPPYNADSYYLEALTWINDIETSDPLEIARAACMNVQKNRIRLDIPSNTTLIGLGTDAIIMNGSLRITGKTNIIIRNIEFKDAYDYFPQWDPTDNWNSQYDLIGIESNSTNIWIDHCTFTDNPRPDNHSEYVIGGKYRQHHDGAIDITKGSNYITISYCYIHTHEKTNLIGGSDLNFVQDREKLKTTFHHNYYTNVGQRHPRVRYGKVHCYNNFYQNVTSYVFGVGTEAAIYAEANSFENVANRITYFPKTGYTLGIIMETNE